MALGLDFSFYQESDVIEVDLPLSINVINDIVEKNQKNQNTAVKPSGSSIPTAFGLAGYLSNTYIKFTSSDFIQNISEQIIDSEYWYNQNSVIANYFKENPERLVQFVKSFFKPNMQMLRNGQCDLQEFTLAQCSVMEFSKPIVEILKKEKIDIQLEELKEASRLSKKRSLIYENLRFNFESRGELKNYLNNLLDKNESEFKFRGTLKKNIFASSKPLGCSKYNTINIHLDILSSCSFSCPGCFVRRKNELPDSWWNDVLSKIQNQRYTEWNELVIGPVDIFSALNFDELFTQKHWNHDLARNFSAITFNSTLIMSDEEISRKFSQLKKIFPTKQLEFFIIVDIDKFLSEDPAYMEFLRKKISLLENSNIIFTINNPEVFYWRFEVPGEIAYRYFQKNFKYTPSFFRSAKPQLIERHLRSWSSNSKEHENILNYTYDSYFGADTYTTLVYKEGKVYWSPCVVDFVFLEAPQFEVHNNDDVLKLRHQKARGQCEGCPKANTCSTKGVFAVKNFLNKDECIMPQDFALSS